MHQAYDFLPGTHSFLTVTISQITDEGEWEVQFTSAAYCLTCHEVFPPGAHITFPCGEPRKETLAPRKPTLTLIEGV